MNGFDLVLFDIGGVLVTRRASSESTPQGCCSRTIDRRTARLHGPSE